MFCPAVNRSSHPKFSVKNMFFREPNTGPTQVFFCEIFEIFKNNYFEEHPRSTASKLKKEEKMNLQF